MTNPARDPLTNLGRVLITADLHARPTREPDVDAVRRGMLRLTQLVARSPRDVLQQLAEVAMELCRAHTCGVSVLEREDGQDVFRWRALAGRLADAIGSSMPRNPSPCGMVLDERASLLMAYPEFHFKFPGPVDPPIVEVLLAPFFDQGEAVGTIWVVAHDEQRKFDREDLRVLTEVCGVASTAYSLLVSMGYVQYRGAPGQAGAITLLEEPTA